MKIFERALVEFLRNPVFTVRVRPDDEIEALRSELARVKSDLERTRADYRKVEMMYCQEVERNIVLRERAREERKR